MYFMAVGVTLPFMPGYFSSLGLTGSQVGTLLAVAPLFSLVSPPLWGQWADRTGRHGRVLATLCLGGSAGYALLARAHGFETVLVALAFLASFSAAVTTLADSIALHEVQKTGSTYASFRTWGSIGFVVSTVVYGAVIDRIDSTTVLVPMVLFLVAGVWAGLTLRTRFPPATGERPDFQAAKRLVQSKGVGWFLFASALHWVACAPYHGSLTLHFTALRLPPLVVSLSSAVAVTSEVLVMASWSRFSGRIGVRRLLLASFAVSGVRWLIIALTSNPIILVGTAALHGLTFGAFYLASVEFMAERAPGSLRATGQALFVAATFGVGGLVGFIGGGRAYDALGGHGLFGMAAALELLPLVATVVAARQVQRLETIEV